MVQEAAFSAAVIKKEAMFGATREHTVGLVRALSDEIVDQHADVSFMPLQNQRGPSPHLVDRVDAGHESLGGGFFIA